MMWKRFVIGVVGFIGVILVAIGMTLFFIDEPLRGYIESNLNENLKGYSVELGAVDFHPIGFSIDFENVILRQEANPDPPLLSIPSWTASLQWMALLKMEIVSDHLIKQANVVLHYTQAEQEVEDKTEVEDRGWQQAVYALYPVTINTFRIEDGFLSYRDQSDHSPLELTNLQLSIENIQNIRSPDGEYPSSIHMEGSLHQSGFVSISGKGNFLSEPFPGVSVGVHVQNVQLKPFIPVASLLNVEIEAGSLNGQGHVEYSPWAKIAKIAKLEIENPHINYVEKSPGTNEPRQDQQVIRPEDRDESKESSEPFKVLVDSASVKNGAFGYLNRTTAPPYKIFVSHLDLQVTGVGVPKIAQKGELTVSAQFMGKGKTSIQGAFRPEVPHPDFDVKMIIGKTDMTTLNDVFKAYGGFDVKSGQFSLFSELYVQDGRVKGYIKPFFDRPEIYHLAQEKTDNIFQQLYEGMIGVVASILENVPRDQVATKTEISGNLKNIKIGTWELIGNLLRNAFIDAMTPALESLEKMGKDR
ncbi:MAG: DUF748 domain-containing protein [Nitrospirales bacterium]|nr:DUF748 domain-containing protein [Nitrospirales bacterium]